MGWLVLAMCGCAQGRAPTLSRAASNRPARDPGRVVWDYEVRASGPGSESLAVEARFAAASDDEIEIDEDAAPFVHDVAYASGASWVTVGIHGGSWAVPCRASGCTVRYRFALADAAARLNRVEGAIASGDVISAPPSTWLMHPALDAETPGRFRLRVHVVPPSRFAIAIPPSPEASMERPDSFEAAAEDLEGAGFAVFGPFHSETVRSGSARADVVIAPHDLGLSDEDVAAWVGSAVRGIAAYYGSFPVGRTLIVVQAERAGSPTRGETLGDGGPSVLVRVPSDLTAAKTRDDWVMTHELLHVTLPSLGRDHAWLSEGLATYVEPIVRAREGLVTPEAFWHDLVEGAPQGLPAAGDEGLDRTHTWGRTYWGGALFCLVADVRIREETNNARSLDDALRGIVATGADVEAHWDIEQFLETGDRATGTRVLVELYRKMALAPGSVDLNEMWRRLGVRIAARGRAAFDDAAPLANIRRAITTPDTRGAGPPPQPSPAERAERRRELL